MSTIKFQIQQHTGHQYEPISGGDYESRDQAIAGMRSLESGLGYRDMRVVEMIEDDATAREGDVVEVGLEADDE